VRELIDSTGAVQARYDYDPYGNRIRLDNNATLNSDFGFTGFYYHEMSGLNLALYRPYSPTLGRWLSRDPLGEIDGLNLYAYVHNNPITNKDLWGLSDNPLHRGSCCNRSRNQEWALVSENNRARWIILMAGECVGGWWSATDCEGMTCGGGFYKVWAPETYLGPAECRTPRCDSFPYTRRRWTPEQQDSKAESPTHIGGSTVGDTPLGYQYGPR
jgi:RHS repeat-associated protein